MLTDSGDAVHPLEGFPLENADSESLQVVVVGQGHKNLPSVWRRLKEEWVSYILTLFFNSLPVTTRVSLVW